MTKNIQSRIEAVTKKHDALMKELDYNELETRELLIDILKEHNGRINIDDNLPEDMDDVPFVWFDGEEAAVWDIHLMNTPKDEVGVACSLDDDAPIQMFEYKEIWTIFDVVSKIVKRLQD